jgi:hypothetical protein
VPSNVDFWIMRLERWTMVVREKRGVSSWGDAKRARWMLLLWLLLTLSVWGPLGAAITSTIAEVDGGGRGSGEVES